MSVHVRYEIAKLWRVGGRGGRGAAFGVSLGETASSEYLGSSTKMKQAAASFARLFYAKRAATRFAFV